MGRLSWLSGWAHCNHQFPSKRETGGTESEKGIWLKVQWDVMQWINYFWKLYLTIWGKYSWANKKRVHHQIRYELNCICVCVYLITHSFSVSKTFTGHWPKYMVFPRCRNMNNFSFLIYKNKMSPKYLYS